MELVRRYRDLIAGGHVDEALEFLSEDFQFVAPDGSTLVYAEIKALWPGSGPEFDHLTLETVVTSLHEVGQNRYLGESDRVFRWKENGEISNVEHRAMLFEVDAGKIRRMTFFMEPKEAWIEAGVAQP